MSKDNSNQKGGGKGERSSPLTFINLGGVAGEPRFPAEKEKEKIDRLSKKKRIKKTADTKKPLRSFKFAGK
jgi:hypothetical protein